MKDYQAEYYEKVKKELLPVLKTAIDNTMDKQVTDYTTLLDAYRKYLSPSLKRFAKWCNVETSVKNEEDSARREGREKAELVRLGQRWSTAEGLIELNADQPTATQADPMER